MSAEQCIHCHKPSDNAIFRKVPSDDRIDIKARLVSYCAKCRQPVCNHCYWEKHPCAR